MRRAARWWRTVEIDIDAILGAVQIIAVIVFVVLVVWLLATRLH